MEWIDGPGYLVYAAVIPGHILGWIKSASIKDGPVFHNKEEDATVFVGEKDPEK